MGCCNYTYNRQEHVQPIQRKHGQTLRFLMHLKNMQGCYANQLNNTDIQSVDMEAKWEAPYQERLKVKRGVSVQYLLSAKL